HEPLQSVGQGSQRQIQPVGLPVFEQAVRGAVEQVLVQQQLHPDGHAQAALGDQLVRTGRGDDAFVGITAANGPVAAAAVDAAVGSDLDRQDLPVLSAGELPKGQTAARALPLVIGQVEVLLDTGQVGMVAARVSGLAWLLAARPVGLGLGLGLTGGGMALALGAEELLLTESELGAERLILSARCGLRGQGHLVHALPVGGRAIRLELLGKSWADRARPFRQRRRGTGGSRQGDALRWWGGLANSLRAGHATRCSSRFPSGQSASRVYRMLTVRAPHPVQVRRCSRYSVTSGWKGGISAT